jgi:hypothetical protein
MVARCLPMERTGTGGRDAVAATGLKRALVIGCSADVWAEVAAAQALGTFDAIYCAKMAGVHWKGGRFTWCGLHPEWQELYSGNRQDLGLHRDYETVAPPDSELGTAGKGSKIDRRVSYRWPGMDASASSGGYAARWRCMTGLIASFSPACPWTSARRTSRAASRGCSATALR